MSYSHRFRAASIAALCAIAVSKMDETVNAQPFHEVDRDAALKNVKAHAEVMGEPPEGHEFAVSMNGSGWSQDGVVRCVGSGCSVQHVAGVPATPGA